MIKKLEFAKWQSIVHLDRSHNACLYIRGIRLLSVRTLCNYSIWLGPSISRGWWLFLHFISNEEHCIIWFFFSLQKKTWFIREYILCDMRSKRINELLRSFEWLKCGEKLSSHLLQPFTSSPFIFRTLCFFDDKIIDVNLSMVNFMFTDEQIKCPAIRNEHHMERLRRM